MHNRICIFGALNPHRRIMHKKRSISQHNLQGLEIAQLKKKVLLLTEENRLLKNTYEYLKKDVS